MRINLTKKDLVNLIYMQIGFSKKITENLVEEFFSIIVSNLRKKKSVKISKFGTFLIRSKSSRIGRNPKTKEEKEISERDVVLFKPSKEFRESNRGLKWKIILKKKFYDKRLAMKFEYKLKKDKKKRKNILIAAKI